MKHKFQKAISMMLTLVVVLNTPTLAVGTQIQTENEVNYVYLESADHIPWDNIPANTAYVVPNDQTTSCLSGRTDSLQPRGMNPPTLEWNVAEDGTCSISGRDTNSAGPLYTQYKYYGAEEYRIVIRNNLPEDILYMTIHEVAFWSPYEREYSVPAGSTLYCFIESQAGFTTSTRWYMYFECPCNVSGSILEN